MNRNEESKYENIIKSISDQQLIYEIAIKEEQYKTISAERKMLQEECKRRLRNK